MEGLPGRSSDQLKRIALPHHVPKIGGSVGLPLMNQKSQDASHHRGQPEAREEGFNVAHLPPPFFTWGSTTSTSSTSEPAACASFTIAGDAKQ